MGPILVHVCCAGCFAKTLAGLRAAFGPSQELRGLFANPNIHPLLEFRRRMKAVQVYTERDPVPVAYDAAYGLVPFCRAVHGQEAPPARCRLCYRMRLGRAAEHARATGSAAFTSTLVTSAHQDHALIRAEGERAAERAGVPFLYRDLREAEAPEGVLKGLYRQGYCGCVFSEAERYGPTATHLYRGSAPGPSAASRGNGDSDGKESAPGGK
jgi:hypothetical protein